VVPARDRDRSAVAAWAAVAAVGIVVGGALCARHFAFHTNAAPFHGYWELDLNGGALLPIAFAAVVVAIGPAIADRLAWRGLLAAAAAGALGWSVALAVTVGGHGLTAPLAGSDEYLAGVRLVDGHFLRAFTDALVRYPVHVKGHPPGFVLILWALDRIGLGGPGWAAILIVVAAASAVPAVLLTVRATAGETAARRLAPFLVLTPAAVWMATSGDAFFTGAGAWAVWATVAATRRRHAVVAGLLWAGVLLLSYGLVLLAPVAVGVVWWRRRFDILLLTGLVSVAALLAVGVGTGFWWPAGLAATRRAYLGGYAPGRAAWVFVWLNLGALAIALGPAVVPALRRLRATPPSLLVGGALVGLAVADLSLLAKGEVERIWLPWTPWVLVATVALPLVARRRWLAAQAATGIAVQLALRSPW
jgi:hypothetical protein